MLRTFRDRGALTLEWLSWEARRAWEGSCSPGVRGGRRYVRLALEGQEGRWCPYASPNVFWEGAHGTA